MSLGLREFGSATARHRREIARGDRTAEQARCLNVVIAQGRRESSRSSDGGGGAARGLFVPNWRMLKATKRRHP
jgi:hypothetical protein